MATCVVDAALYEQERESRMSARRFNKHIAERKRRARINTALDELKTMIVGNMNKDPEEFEKMEKADILDLTVKFLRAAQQQNKVAARAAPVHKPLPVAPQQVPVTAAYVAGYSQSVNQVQRYLAASDMDHATAARLAAHLTSCNVIPTSSVTSSGRPILPRPSVRRCDPSARLCRDLTREINNNYIPARDSTLKMVTGSAGTDLCSSFRSLATTSGMKPHPAVSHRVVPAHQAVSGCVWRPWVSA